MRLLLPWETGEACLAPQGTQTQDSPHPPGNILGSLLAAYMLQYGWGWSFIVPGIVIVVMGALGQRWEHAGCRAGALLACE